MPISMESFKILCVDDFDLIHSLFKAAFTRPDYEVVSAMSGAEGLEQLVKHNGVDLIFCDIIMPVMDGHQFCRALRTQPEYSRYSRTPIISISGYSEQQLLEADGHLQKPLNMHQLSDVVRQYHAITRVARS
jgi:CheY-like chemotaxis protein